MKSAHILPADTWNHFHYDGRLARYCIEDSQGVKYYCWDGLNLLERYNLTTDTQRTSTHGPTPIAGIGNLVLRSDSCYIAECYYAELQALLRRVAMVQFTESGGSYAFEYDHRGSVFNITDGSQDIVQSYEHDAWGVRLASEGNLENPLQYQACARMGGRMLTLSAHGPNSGGNRQGKEVASHSRNVR